MGWFQGKVGDFLSSRWFVFVAAMWVQSGAGVGYMFGSMSPVMKDNLGYNQRQIAGLGIAKDAGDFVGLFAGSLSSVLPYWALLLVGASNNFIGYGWLWLIVSGRAPAVPLWAMCILFFVGTNGETYYSTASLVSCINNFSDNRGPVVGILKGFSGLSGAILTQFYKLIHTTDQSAVFLMVAVVPSVVAIALMFVVRPVEGRRKVGGSHDHTSFEIIYVWCLVLAAYLMGVMLLEDLLSDLSNNVILVFAVMLIFIVILPVLIPLVLTFNADTKSRIEEEPLLPVVEVDEMVGSKKVEEKNSAKNVNLLQAALHQAASAGAARLERSGPHRGEDFTLMQAFVKADFWLLFMVLLIGTGTGLSVIDNLGQMSQSLGYRGSHSFVSMISIWNFLGRIAGGYLSEIVVKTHALPRPLALAATQILMAIGHVFFAMAWPGTMYIGTFLIGLTYGAHWSITPAALSELFGLKHFGALYNFIAVSSPAGSFIFSVLITSNIYEFEAEKQARTHLKGTPLLGTLLTGASNAEEPLKCMGPVCFFLSSLIMSGFCLFAVILSMILFYRTKVVYSKLYAKANVVYK